MSDYEIITGILDGAKHLRPCKAREPQDCVCGLARAREVWAEIQDRSMELTQTDFDPLAALDQMEQERQAMQQLYDLDKAYSIYFDTFVPFVALAAKLAMAVRNQGGMFLPPALTEMGEKVIKLWDKLEIARKGLAGLKDPDQTYQAGFEEVESGNISSQN